MMKSVVLVLVIGVVYCNDTSNYKFTSNDRYGKQLFGTIEVRNNVWGDKHGPQEIFAMSGSQWAVKCSHEGGGIKSYPHSGQMYNKPLSAIHTLTSSYTVTSEVKNPGTLAYSATYDIWLQKHYYEIMIWGYYCGPIGPLGDQTHASVALGGHDWKVHKGTNTKNLVYSFLALKPSNSMTIDLKAILEWICAQGWFIEKEAVILDEVQFGFEITTTPPNTTLSVTSYDIKCT